MRFFKSIKRKVGNAIVPVIGTILGLTILAGSIVGVAVNSSKIVYRENNLDNQNDARQILYLACKYFCQEINPPANKSATVIRQELQDIFGPGLKITQDKNKEDTYYIWYPNKYKSGTEYTDDDNVAEWLKATITKKETADDDGDYGNNGIGKTIFQEDAKIDEKYAIGNLMTSYLADASTERPEKLLPGRTYSVDQISLVESDIDTFDEAFTYMNNTGVLQIDDVAVALYKFAVLDEGTVDYISTPSEIFDPQHSEKQEKAYTIVYKTGNLGGNYYWLDGDENKETWLYRQEYDLKLLADMVNYFKSSTKATENNLTYSYDETTDKHTITCSALSLGDRFTYSSSQKFADDIAEYLFWKNIPYLAVNLSTVRNKMYEKINNELSSNYVSIDNHTARYTVISDYSTFKNHIDEGDYYTSSGYYGTRYYYAWIEQNYYEWDNDGLKIYINFRDYRLPGPDGLRWYRTHSYNSSNSIINFIQDNKIEAICDVTGKHNNKKYTFSAQKLYNALINEYSTIAVNEYKYKVYEKQAQSYYLDPNNYNDLINDVQNNNWNDGGCFSNSNKQTTTTYYKSDLEVKRYVRQDNGSYNENPSGSYLSNPNIAEGVIYFGTFSAWNNWYNDSTNTSKDYDYFIDENGYLNPSFYTTGGSKSSFTYQVSTGNDKLTQQIIDYLTGIFKQKMSTTAGLTELITTGIASSQSGEKQKMSFEGFAGDGDQMIYQPQVFYENGRFKLQYRYNVIVRFVVDKYEQSEKYISKFRYSQDNWVDTIYLSKEEFFTLFAEGLAEKYVDKRMSTSEKEVIEQVITKTEVKKQYLKQLLVEAMRYQYFPNSSFTSIVGDNVENGMREDQITNKLITYYVENNKSAFSAVGTSADGSENFNYKIDILSNDYEPYTGTGEYINYVVKFMISVDTNGDGDYTDSTDVKITKRISFLLQYMTYSPLNNARFSNTTYTYTDVKNNNFKSVTSAGVTENIFWLVPIKDSDSQTLNYNSITTKNIPTILTAIPYTKRVNSTAVPYGDHKVTVDAAGTDYTEISGISSLPSTTEKYVTGYNVDNGSEIKNYAKNVNKNYIIKGDVTISSGVLVIQPECSLFIDGRLTLKDDARIILGRKSMLYVNNNLTVEYEYTQEMDYTQTIFSKTWSARQLTDKNIRYFRSHGVDIKAESDAKIIVNGNFDYTGVKAKKATSSTFNIRIANDPSGLLMDRVYEQYVFNTGFKTGNNCSQDEEGHWTHYQTECRSSLQGIYIVNGDIIFHASNDKLTTNGTAAEYQWYAMYSNAYSNPIVNATFYADGTFDMTGLYTSGLYDKCRANFIFSKSITQPYVQLNTILCAEDPTYGGWEETDGYLFIICEEAIDFSKDSFGSVNLFTPFQELVNAINNHKTSETNFASFIKEGEFKSQFPDKTVIRDWGLPPLLMSGFTQMYQPGDIGNIKAEDTFNGAGDTVI